MGIFGGNKNQKGWQTPKQAMVKVNKEKNPSIFAQRKAQAKKAPKKK